MLWRFSLLCRTTTSLFVWIILKWVGKIKISAELLGKMKMRSRKTFLYLSHIYERFETFQDVIVVELFFQSGLHVLGHVFQPFVHAD